MTANKEITLVSQPTLRRLPLYLQVLKILKEKDIKETSTTHFANALNLDPTQVRKDLAYTGIVGRPKIGYEVNELIAAIESFLNWNNLTDAFLAGAGNLGTALLGYNELRKYGINIIAAFDSDPYIIGTDINGINILPIEKLPDLAGRMKIKIGILTVPAGSAQPVADMMIEGGIEAIWNFAPTTLTAPENIIVENAGFTPSLAVLSRKLTEKSTRKK